MIDNQNYENQEKTAFIKSIIKKEIIKNYCILILGLFIMSFGVALSVISDLGTTPISCIPNVIKYACTLSLGIITIIFNLFLIFIQVIILRSDFEKETMAASNSSYDIWIFYRPSFIYFIRNNSIQLFLEMDIMYY